VAEDSAHSDDGQLLRDLREGGEKGHRACTELYRRYFEELVRRLGRMDRSVAVEDREDAVQVVFEQLWEGRAYYRSTGPLLAYLTSCARHRLTDLLRQRQARQLREAATGSSPAEKEGSCKLDPHAVLWAYERDEGVREAVRGLPPDQRRVVELVYFGGHSYEEVAGYFRVSRNTIKKRCYAAITALEQALAGLLPGR
jgi:RNA polymerase sigma-70 factor (ECF subfamily)